MAAAETFGEIMFGDGYVLGGAATTPDIAFGDAPVPMFDDPPKCWLHRQASFINSFFPEDTVAGVDYDWFPLPPIDQEGTLFAGELTVVGKHGNRPEVVDFLDRFIAEHVQCEMGGVMASSRISPERRRRAGLLRQRDPGRRVGDPHRRPQEGTGRFDASDLMPAEVGSGSFWTGMIQYVKEGPDSLETVLADIEASWPED